MITNIYFETFTSGWKVRLDPTYRQLARGCPLSKNTIGIGNLIKAAGSAPFPYKRIRD